MSKPRKKATDLAVYVLVRSAVCAGSSRLRVALGRRPAWFAYRVDRRHREVARDNLRHAFPERCADPAECDRLVRGCFRHFCTMVIEIACLPRRIQVSNWRKFGTPQGFDRFMPLLLSDRPVLLVTAHYGNWEVAGYVTGLVGLRTFAIARDLDNPHLHRFFEKFRQKTGQTILGKSNDFDRITAALQAGGKVATLGDQDAGPRGLFVEFFGRPASTHKAVALLSLQHDAPMVVLGIPRVGWPMRFNIEIEDIVDPREYSARQGNSVRAMTERFTKAIERMVRRHPEQYFWLHRRWKHQPPVKKAVPAGSSGRTTHESTT